jgi:signal transduction histidine kinase
MYMLNQIQAHTEKALLAVMQLPVFTAQSSLRGLQSEFLRMCCLVVLSLNLLLLFVGSWVSYQFYGVITLVSLTMLLLNKRGNFNATRWIFMSCVHGAVFLLSAYRVDLLFTYGVMLAGMLLSYVLFFNEELWQLVGNVLVMLIIFSVFQVTSYTLPMHVEVTDELLNRAFFVNIICILMSVGLSLLYLIIVYENSERDLRGTLAELQLRNQEMDHYVYRVSHDLRAPLCSVTGLVNLSAEEEDPAVLRNYLTMIGNTVSKSDGFIQSVLTHSKVLNTEIQPTVLHLDTLIRDSFGDLRYLAGWDQVQLQVEMDAPVPFHNDLFRLSIILNNLIANAITFRNAEAGSCFLSFRIAVDAQRAVLVVADNGTGIGPECLDKIFDMFYRGSERSTGSGLGLYIVKQALEKINGTIQVQSSPGTGSTFTLTLPNYN